MATKAQERAALEKIRKIVDGLGEESYIGQAMDGVLEDAEQNIENDFWNSYKSRYEYRDAECERYEKEVANLKIEMKGLEAEKKLNEESSDLAVRNLMSDRFKAINELNEEKSHRQEAENKAEELQRKVEEQELEIIKLKAKLYDIMVQGA